MSWRKTPRSNVSGEDALFVSVKKITEVNKRYWKKKAEKFGFETVVLFYKKDGRYIGEEFMVDE